MIEKYHRDSQQISRRWCLNTIIISIIIAIMTITILTKREVQVVITQI